MRCSEVNATAAIPLCGIGRSDPAGRDKQTWRPDPAKRDYSPEMASVLKSLHGEWQGKPTSRPAGWGRPMTGGKKRVNAPPDPPG